MLSIAYLLQPFRRTEETNHFNDWEIFVNDCTLGEIK